MHTPFTISGQLVDLHNRRIYPASVAINNGRIESIKEVPEAPDHYILPGFIDAHVHVESSMLVPTQFARLAVLHGTVATISDPHEIANVCGTEGVLFMIEDAQKAPLKIFFGAPSCVPATGFETAGATLDAAAVKELLQHPDIWYLTEMMNYPGVLHKDPEVMAKLAAAQAAGKPIDGHAPGLRGEQAAAYAAAGITTDHECVTLEEALGKIAAGMHILIREGSAAKNFEALVPLFQSHPASIMLCSDDKHPDDLVAGHINRLVMRALAKGYDLFDVLRAACIHPVQHYNIPVGTLREGDPADFIIADSLATLNIQQTYINGQLVAESGKALFNPPPATPINSFLSTPRQPEDFALKAPASTTTIRVIEAIEGQLVTNPLLLPATVQNGNLVSNTTTDVLKLVVLNRYEAAATPAIAFIKNFGLQQGAIASTVAHDCHNIICVGVDDASIAAAINALISNKGGISVATNEQDVTSLPLPVAGLMSTEDGYTVGRQYAAISGKAKALGSPLHAPFMTLSFMALLVIPSLKLSDKGLFNGTTFSFTDVAVTNNQ